MKEINNNLTELISIAIEISIQESVDLSIKTIESALESHDFDFLRQIGSSILLFAENGIKYRTANLILCDDASIFHGRHRLNRMYLKAPENVLDLIKQWGVIERHTLSCQNDGQISYVHLDLDHQMVKATLDKQLSELPPSLVKLGDSIDPDNRYKIVSIEYSSKYDFAIPLYAVTDTQNDLALVSPFSPSKSICFDKDHLIFVKGSNREYGLVSDYQGTVLFPTHPSESFLFIERSENNVLCFDDSFAKCIFLHTYIMQEDNDLHVVCKKYNVDVNEVLRQHGKISKLIRCTYLTGEDGYFRMGFDDGWFDHFFLKIRLSFSPIGYYVTVDYLE